jgi:hypothetical protein
MTAQQADIRVALFADDICAWTSVSCCRVSSQYKRMRLFSKLVDEWRFVAVVFFR